MREFEPPRHDDAVVPAHKPTRLLARNVPSSRCSKNQQAAPRRGRLLMPQVRVVRVGLGDLEVADGGLAAAAV